MNEVVVFQGVSYSRIPDAKKRQHRVYFNATGRGSLHRAIWESVNGPVPKGFHIHHRDFDPLNNDISNLECVSPKEHAARHQGQHKYDLEHLARIRPLAACWHSSPEGMEWHRKHADDVFVGRPTHKAKCQQCGAEFDAVLARARFCSRRCIQQGNEQRKRYYEERACVMCGVSFTIKKSKLQQTCSRQCGAVRRHQAHPRTW